MGFGSSGAEEVWRGRLKRYAASGQTITKFCDKERVSTASFYRWRLLLGNELSLNNGGAFRRIEVAPSNHLSLGGAERGGMVTIAFGCGARVEIPCDAIDAVRAAVGELAKSGQNKDGRIVGVGPC